MFVLLQVAITPVSITSVPAMCITPPTCFQPNLLVLEVMNRSVITDEVSLTITLDMMNHSVSPDAMNLTIALDAMNCYVTPDVVDLTIVPDTMNNYATPDGVDSTIMLDMMNHSVSPDVMNLTIALDAMNCYATPDGVDSTIVPDTMNCYVTPDGVDSTIALDAMQCYVTPDGVDITIVLDVMQCYVIPDGVDMTILLDMMQCYVIPDGLNMTIALNVMSCYVNSDVLDVTIHLDIINCYMAMENVISQVNELIVTVQVNGYAGSLEQKDSQCCSDADINILMEKPVIHGIHGYASVYSLYNQKDLPLFVDTCVFVQKDQTAVYDVAEYPYFVFCSYQSDLLSFGETCKVYMHHLSKYQLVHLIEFIFHWSNHICYFVLQNMNMLVNLNLTPQQLCQRALLTIRS